MSKTIVTNLTIINYFTLMQTTIRQARAQTNGNEKLIQIWTGYLQIGKDSNEARID